MLRDMIVIYINDFAHSYLIVAAIIFVMWVISQIIRRFRRK